VESFCGTFSRKFSLPENVDTRNVRAESREDVLKTHIPKTEMAKPKPMSIDVK
jgi:HSP20 family protein